MAYPTPELTHSTRTDGFFNKMPSFNRDYPQARTLSETEANTSSNEREEAASRAPSHCRRPAALVGWPRGARVSLRRRTPVPPLASQAKQQSGAPLAYAASTGSGNVYAGGLLARNADNLGGRPAAWRRAPLGRAWEANALELHSSTVAWNARVEWWWPRGNCGREWELDTWHRGLHAAPVTVEKRYTVLSKYEVQSRCSHNLPSRVGIRPSRIRHGDI
jgi:hypothetical protein